MPPRRTFSDVNRELEAVKATADRLRRERNEVQDDFDALGLKYQKVKKVLKAKTKPAAKKKIPKPPGQAGRKPTIDKNGRKRGGYSLQDAMNLTDQKAVYLDFRSIVTGNISKDKYDSFKAIPILVRGSICAKVLKKYPWLDDFEGHWPVDDVLRGNFDNRTSYRKDKESGSLARRKRARKEGEGGGGGGGRVDVDEDELAMAVYDEANLDGYRDNSDDAGEAENETNDEEEDDTRPRGVPGRKRVKSIESDDEEEEEVAVEAEQPPLISRKRKRGIDEEPEEDARRAIHGKMRPVPSRTASPALSRNPLPAPAPLRSPSPSPVPSRGRSASLSPAPSNYLTPTKTPTPQPTNKAKKTAKKYGSAAAPKAGPRRSGRNK